MASGFMADAWAEGPRPAGPRLSDPDTRAQQANPSPWGLARPALGLRALAHLTLAATEPCRALGVAVAVRALDQQARVDRQESAWEAGGQAWEEAKAGPDYRGGLGSAVAWSIGPSAQVGDRLATWRDPAQVARGFRSWSTAQAQDRQALRLSALGPACLSSEVA